jgi:DNA-3-methyladenine glycosylase II
MSPTDLLLHPLPPFRLDLAVWTLRRRPDNLVDRWDGQTYRRVLTLPTGPLEVAVTQAATPAAPELHVTVMGQPLDTSIKAAVTAALERLLGLQTDLGAFHKFASRQKKLGSLAKRFRGMKPPRFASVFEGVLNGIACQQVTLTLGINLLNRLATRYGIAIGDGAAAVHAFPRPDDLARLSSADLRELGFSHQKGRAMVELSQSIVEGHLNLEELAELPDDEAVRRLQELRGVGRWTAEYCLLRGLGRTHVFPGDDVGARNNLQRWLELEEPPNYEGIQRALDPWRHYGGLIYFHLLLDRLAAAEYLSAAMNPTTLPP